MQPDAIDDRYTHVHSLGFGGFRHPAEPDLPDPADNWGRARYFRTRRRGALRARAMRSGCVFAAAPGPAARRGAPARRAVAAAAAARSLGRAELRAEIDQLTHRGGGFQRR